MKIRPYTANDESGCLEVFHSNGTDFFTEQEVTLFQKWLHKAAQIEEAYYFVVDDNGTIQGCGGFYLDEEEQKATLAWGMIRKSHHKQGLGEKLLRFRLEKIKELLPKGRIILLDTTQKTFKFFEKLGFEVSRVREGYYREDLDRYDMELKL